MKNETILISGASSGIGKATAMLLAKSGRNLILTGRRSDRLTELKRELELLGVQVFTGVFDIQSRKETEAFVSTIPEEFQSIRVLVNNAGLAAGLSSIQDGDIDDWDQMIDTNLKGLLYLTKAIIPLLRKVEGSQIINIGSIAGKEVYPNGNVYCASKHAVDALTRAMRIDLLPLNIRVSSVSPGMVETEFSLVRFKGDADRASSVYKGMEPLKAEDIADSIKYIIDSPYRVTIGDILILPSAQAASRDVKRENN
ncbi:MAG TPA: SDR family NAD(P)-dependent oxidoreductase [Flavobacteriales bacterium]|nr:SDR family NAD(P)-dependent oxidoreductase [Flavobacteriales bacterium]